MSETTATEKVKKARITNEAFIEAYQTSESNDEVVTKTGLSKAGIAQRVKALKAKDVPLKKMARKVSVGGAKRGPAAVDYAALIALATSYLTPAAPAA